MAPNGESFPSSYSNNKNKNINFSKPPRLSMESLQRSVSDLSFQLSKEAIDAKLPPISEVEDAKCECCGMSEECTLEYIQRVRDKFSGKWICGLCAEAVEEEVEKNGGRRQEALSSHTSVCVRFNRIGRIYPALYHAEAMRELFKKSARLDGKGVRAKSISPRDTGGAKKGVGIARSSSCIPAITREMNDPTLVS